MNFIYTTSQTFLNPFREIFPPKPVSNTGYLDVAALFAIIIYALIGWGFKAFIDYVQAKSSQYVQRAETESQPESDYETDLEQVQTKPTPTRLSQGRPPRRV